MSGSKFVKGSSDDIPRRDYMDGAEIKWRNGKPNYDVVNKKYLNERTKRHVEGSLEKIVENLVKTWEMESTHKMEAKDWSTVDREKFFINTNGGRRFTLRENIEIGNYNMLLHGCPLFDTEKLSNEESHRLFRKALPNGFAWELLELQSGPPVVSFTWRHWAMWEGPFGDTPPSGHSLAMYGSCVVRVNEQLKIESIEVFYDPNPFIAKLMNFNGPKCPF